MIPTDAAKNRFADAIPPTMPTSGPMAWTPWSVEQFSAKLSASHPHYRILNLISHGGMGAVYQATDTQKGHTVAIKVMRPDLLTEGDFVERFQREIQMLRELDHPHIVSLVDRSLTADGVPFLVMPLLEGRSLAKVIQDKERLTLPRILALMQQLCSGTAALHDKGIIHRDLKPANIFLRAPDDHAIILDLGIARPQMPLDGLHTQTGLTLGTESYMAPEVKAGKKAEKPADIYALGVILYQLLTQRLPEGNYQLASEWVKEPRIDEVVAKAIHADPMKRHKSVTEFAEALQDLTLATTMLQATATADDEYPTPDPASIVIELDDMSLVVNGLDFSFDTNIEDWMQVFGKYDEVKNFDSDGNQINEYFWFQLGLCTRMIDQQFERLSIAPRGTQHVEQIQATLFGSAQSFCPFRGSFVFKKVKVELQGSELEAAFGYGVLSKSDSEPYRWPSFIDRQLGDKFKLQVDGRTVELALERDKIWHSVFGELAGMQWSVETIEIRPGMHTALLSLTRLSSNKPLRSEAFAWPVKDCQPVTISPNERLLMVINGETHRTYHRIERGSRVTPERIILTNRRLLIVEGPAKELSFDAASVRLRSISLLGSLTWYEFLVSAAIFFVAMSCVYGLLFLIENLAGYNLPSWGLWSAKIVLWTLMIPSGWVALVMGCEVLPRLFDIMTKGDSWLTFWDINLTTTSCDLNYRIPSSDRHFSNCLFFSFSHYEDSDWHSAPSVIVLKEFRKFAQLDQMLRKLSSERLGKFPLHKRHISNGFRFADSRSS